MGHRNSMSSQYSRIEEFMSKISQDFQEFKKDNIKTTQILVGQATTLTTHGNSLASILKTQDKQQRELNHLQNQNTTLTQDIAEQTDRITQLEKTVEDLTKSTEDLTAKNLNLQNALKDIEDLKTQVTTQNDIIDTINNKQTTNSTKIIQEQVQAHIDTLNAQEYWQRELDRSANQLVFKNLGKKTHTSNMHPREIFISNILNPMSLNTEDEAKITPISVFDANKGKDNASTHFLICTFSSVQAISLIKQIAKKIPKQVRFCPRVPLQYTNTLNKFLKTQGQIRLLKDKNGIPIARTKLTTNKGHLILEKSDRTAETFGPFYPIQTFIPEASDSALSISPIQHTKTHALIQCRWKEPVPLASQEEIKAHLKDADMEYASFNHTSHLLSITTKAHIHDKTSTYLRLNPTINASKISNEAF